MTIILFYCTVRNQHSMQQNGSDVLTIPRVQRNYSVFDNFWGQLETRNMSQSLETEAEPPPQSQEEAGN